MHLEQAHTCILQDSKWTNSSSNPNHDDLERLMFHLIVLTNCNSTENFSNLTQHLQHMHMHRQASGLVVHVISCASLSLRALLLGLWYRHASLNLRVLCISLVSGTVVSVMPLGIIFHEKACNSTNFVE